MSETSGPGGARSSSIFPRLTVAALAVAMLATTGLTLWAASGQNAADAAVVNAVTSAVNDRTAALSLTGSIQIGGATIPFNGTGSVDFTQNDMKLQFTETAGGQQITEGVVDIDHSLYFNLGDLGGRLLPGKSWVSLDLSQISQGNGAAASFGIGGSTTTNDPEAILRILGQDGNTATDLGPSTIGGVPVEGYAVQVNAAAIRARFDNHDLPTWMRHALAPLSHTHVAYKLFINQSGQLVRQTSVVDLTVNGHSIRTVDSVDYSDFGAPVSIAAPPADQVASFEAFLQAAQAASSTTT